jgi:hypothetical protein
MMYCFVVGIFIVNIMLLMIKDRSEIKHKVYLY